MASMTRTTHYVLQDGEPVAEANIRAWAQWFETTALTERVVKKTRVQVAADLVEVSTVFLGMDYNFGGDGPPVLWETCIFGGPLDREIWRYRSREDAETGHMAVVKMAELGSGLMSNLRMFGPKLEDHPGVGLACPICGHLFEAGDYTTLVAVAPASEDDSEKMQQGRAYNARAEEVCWSHADVLTYAGKL